MKFPLAEATENSIKFFGVYDGHGGKGCAEYLLTNLHKFIAASSNFPYDIIEAIQDGCFEAES